MKHKLIIQFTVSCDYRVVHGNCDYVGFFFKIINVQGFNFLVFITDCYSFLCSFILSRQQAICYFAAHLYFKDC